MAIYQLEHSYLNWRAIPCKENDLYLCSFSSFSQHFFLTWLSWFSFRLNSNFSSAWHNNQFFFCSFFFIHFSLFFLNGLLWAMSHVVDGLPAWSISSHMRIVLKGLAFGSRLLVSFLFRGYGSEVFPKNEQFSIDVPQDINQGDFRVSRSWDFVLLMEKVWHDWNC